MRLKRVTLASALTQSRESVAPDPERVYMEMKLRQAGAGAVVRRRVEGSALPGRRSVARAGQFVVSKIDARNGSMAIVPAELDGALVTSDFPLFNVNQGVMDIDYLSWLCRTSSFVRMCQRASRGTTNRKRLKESALLALEVTLPSVEDQVRIADRLDALERAGFQAAQLASTLVDLSEELLSARFTSLVHGSPRAPFGAIASVVRRPVTPAQGDSFPELGIRSFGRGTFHKPALDYWSLGNKRLFRIEEGDLLLSNVFAWEGAIAVAGPEDHDRFGSHRFISCVPDPSVADARFLRYYLLSEEGLNLIGKASPGGAGRNRTLGLRRMAAIPVPIPPLEQQLRFVDALVILERLKVQRDRLTALHREALAAALRELIPPPDRTAVEVPS